MPKILKNKLSKNKKAFLFLFFLLLSFGVFSQVNAQSLSILDLLRGFDVKRMVLLIIGNVVEVLINLFGNISNLVIGAIISIAEYNSFIEEESVETAWAIIRDFCNMFFILILLVIAFATILRIESYNMKKWLPKLIIMAVLINFSKTIAGLIIDFAQVFMLTFVSAFNGGGAGFVEALGISRYFDMADESIMNAEEDPNFFSTVIAMLLALMFLVIATIVLGVVLAVLVIRMVMLWIYIILSPLAFLLAAFPGGQKYSNRWWDEFIKQVITGPILAFFIWLALVSSNSFTPTLSTSDCFGFAEVFCPGNFVHYIMAIGMLIGGLIITSQAGGAAAGVASKGMGAINKGKSFALRKTGSGVKKTGKFAGRKTLSAGRQADRLLGHSIGMQGGAVGTGLQTAANKVTFAKTRNNWRANREKKEKRHETWTQYQKAMKLEGDERKKALNDITYRHGDKDYKVNEKGEFYREDGAPVDGKVKKLSSIEAKRYEAARATNSTAWNASNAARDKKVEEEKEGLKGYSEAMLHATSKDGSVSMTKRRAAASLLGEKDAFIDGASEKEVKELHGMLEGKTKDDFKDSVVKRNAKKILATKDGKLTAEGRKDYEKAVRKGKVDDDLSESELKDGEVSDIIRGVSKRKWKRIIDNAKETDKKMEAATEGLKKSLKLDDHVLKNGILNPIRKDMLELNDDLAQVFEDVVDPEKIKKGVDNAISNMSPAQLAKLNKSNFDRGAIEKKFKGDTDRADVFQKTFNSSVDERSKDPRFIEQIRRAEGNNVEYFEERKKNVDKKEETEKKDQKKDNQDNSQNNQGSGLVDKNGNPI